MNIYVKPVLKEIAISNYRSLCDQSSFSIDPVTEEDETWG